MEKRFKNTSNRKIKSNGMIIIFIAVGMGLLASCSSAKVNQQPEKNEPVTETDRQPENNEPVTASEIDEDTGNVENDETGQQNVPDIVQQKAEEFVEELYLDGWLPADTYTDWRIASLTHSYTYEDFNGMALQVYRLNYEFLADKPEEIQLVGGMSIDEDGWVVASYPNSDYLIFQQDGDRLAYLRHMFENDCLPGDETFTSDLQRLYDMGELMEE